MKEGALKTSRLSVVLLLLLTGCSHTIKYKLAEGDRWTGPKINKVICVEAFPDNSARIAEKEEKINGEHWRLNYRSKYKSPDLSPEVSAAIVKHFAYSGLFDKVVTAPETNADYFLSGRLTEFSAMGQVNEGAETAQSVSSGFGAIGAVIGIAATAGSKSQMQSTVNLEDLKLVDRTGQVIWSDSIRFTTNFSAHFDSASAPAVFFEADRSLKQAVSETIRRIGNSQSTNRLERAAR
jgi:hypothetical protein